MNMFSFRSNIKYLLEISADRVEIVSENKKHFKQELVDVIPSRVLEPFAKAAISLYPKGDARSPSGMAALYLWVEEPIKIKVRDVVETWM